MSTEDKMTKIVSPTEWLSILTQHRGADHTPVDPMLLTLPTPPVPGASYGGEINGIRYWIAAPK